MAAAARPQPRLPGRRLAGLALAGTLILAGCSSESGDGPTEPSAAPETSSITVADGTDIATGLDVPWEATFLPDGSALVTLRDEGRVVRVRPDTEPVDLGEIPGVVAGGEGGLLGAAVSPTFDDDRRVYLYLTAAQDNRVVRATLDGDRIEGVEPILTGIPKAGIHNGGRIAFGPDGMLYVATGDAGDTARSQDRDDLAGKILRITADGDPAPGNPFDTAIWSWGHRNVQGLAWSEDDTMWASEFGQGEWDELNRIEPGKNYGWPEVEGEGGEPDFTDPEVVWRTGDASPSGITVGSDGAVYIAALRGESVWRVPVTGRGADVATGTPERLWQGRYGRIRDISAAPNGDLWVLTSNTFRGTPRDGDDRILRLTPPGS